MDPQPLAPNDDQARIIEVGRLRLGDVQPDSYSADLTIAALARHIIKMEDRLASMQHRLNIIETELEL